ncbi:MAG: DNA-processing protein DprA, partial [Calditrichia bacterium]|nr:DNA-processing protein DprA [Calditrichia bacterium]
DPAKIFELSRKELLKIPGFSQQLIEVFKVKPDGKFAEQQLNLRKEHNAHITHLWADNYPQLLKQIPDPPPLLWYKGNIDAISDNALVIIGTRRPTSYGKRMTETITRELLDKKITIISGLARGIDSIAHFTTVKFGGTTVGVMASGVDIIYPPENKKLAEEITANGVIISEFPFGTKPEPAFFFRRNRIISGLGKGIIVVEAGKKSGALITAAFGLEQNREVFALPGQVNVPQSLGCLRLLQDGAKLIINTDDILSEFPAFQDTVKKQPTLTLLSKIEGKVYDTITDNPIYIDKIVDITKLSLGELNSILLDLELEGYITQLSGKMFIKG